VDELGRITTANGFENIIDSIAEKTSNNTPRRKKAE